MIDFIKNLLFVPKCFSCGEVLAEDDLFCDKCRLEWDQLTRVPCKTCGKKQRECACVPTKLRADVTRGVHLVLFEDELSRRVIYAVKHKMTSALCRFLARSLSRVIREEMDDLSDFAITYAPRKPKSVREYGFDQAELLAEAIAEELSLPMLDLFCHARRSKLQKNLGATERAENAKKSYFLCDDACAPTKKLMIVDDVITTGSTMEALASLAKTLGFEEIVVVTIAKTPAK